jgi:hypothetical protein
MWINLDVDVDVNKDMGIEIDMDIGMDMDTGMGTDTYEYMDTHMDIHVPKSSGLKRLVSLLYKRCFVRNQKIN